MNQQEIKTPDNFMSVEDAFELVIELARQNVISEGEVMQDEVILRPMQKKQQQACDIVEDYFVNVITKDYDCAGPVVVEYDLNYSGGNYKDVGSFITLNQMQLIQAGGNVAQAFQMATGIDSIHIVNYRLDKEDTE